MTYDINLFESLGANCEFGFYLRDKDNQLATLFKWAAIPKIRSLISLLNSDLDDVLSYENVEPFNQRMVFDTKFEIAWHAPLFSSMIDPNKGATTANLQFNDAEPERRRIWSEQEGKTRYLVERFRKSLATGEIIYVFKPLWGDTIGADDILALHDALCRDVSNRLLAVTIAEEPSKVGTAAEIRPGLVHGFIDRFAPGSAAGDYSAPVWDTICGQAYQLLK